MASRSFQVDLTPNLELAEDPVAVCNPRTPRVCALLEDFSGPGLQRTRLFVVPPEHGHSPELVQAERNPLLIPEGLVYLQRSAIGGLGSSEVGPISLDFAKPRQRRPCLLYTSDAADE